LVNVHEIHKRLTAVAEDLSRLAGMPPHIPLSSKEMLGVAEKLHKDSSSIYGFYDASLIPVFYIAFLELHETIYNLYRFLAEIRNLCDFAKRYGVEISPDPCDHVLDSKAELVVKDFRRARKMLRRRFIFAPTEVDTFGTNFLEMLKFFSLSCSFATEGTCLRYASPEAVIPASLRTYVSDLHSATDRLARKFADLYLGVEEWRVGSIRLYEHPDTTPGLSDLAERAANILHKEAELQDQVASKVAVFSLKDRVAVGMREFGSVVARPRWVIEVYGYDFMFRPLYGILKYITPIDVLKDVLDDRGFRTELTAYGLEITVPPGDVAEALKTTLILPLIPQTAETKEALYGILISRFRLLESKLKEQKPVKKSKRSL
jgi:hypothetical protein